MKPKNEYIILMDGRKIFLSDILRLSSFDLYQTTLHYDICMKLARCRGSDLPEQRLLTNLYALKSRLVRSATALSAYIANADSPVTELCISSRLLSLLSPEITRGRVIHDWRGGEPDYLERSQVTLLLAKAVIHKLFRLIPRRRIVTDIFVRGWVEVTSKMYEEEMRQGGVLIYPFALNLVRQLKFILFCSKQNIRYEFVGLPYSLIKIVREWAIGVPHDKILLNAEISANRQHGDELLRRAPKMVFTSDEFETGAFILYEKLLVADVQVVNTAHGVGQYCPHICYSEFRVISDSQSRFYKERNPSIKYSVIPTSNMRILGVDSYKLSLRKRPAFVLVHQPFKESALYAEDDAIRHLDAMLSEASRNLSVPYFVKLHPNHRSGIFRRDKREFKGKPVFEWKALNEFRLIFITVNSSVFFDVRGLGPILVYAGTTFDPSLYFPGLLLDIQEANGEAMLKRLISVENWAAAAAVHAGEAITACGT